MGALDFILEWAWPALVVAFGVLALATISVVGGPVMEALDRRIGARVGRRVRTMAGRTPEAPPWVCGACHSVNGAAVEACYHCGALRPAEGGTLLDEDRDHLYAAPRPVNRFDPSLYRGPGAPPPADEAAPVPSTSDAADGAEPG